MCLGGSGSLGDDAEASRSLCSGDAASLQDAASWVMNSDKSLFPVFSEIHRRPWGENNENPEEAP